MLPKRNAYITKLLVASWFFIFVLDVSVFTNATDLNHWFVNILFNSHGKLNGLLVLIPVRVENHEYWRIISYAFTHFGAVHIVGNILLISFVGNILESRVRNTDMIFPLLWGDVIAGIVGMAVVGSVNAYINGSSPGIYALYGVLAANLLFRKLKATEYMSVRVRNRIVFILLIVNFLGFNTLVIHAVGFTVGFLCGFIQVKRNRIFKT